MRAGRAKGLTRARPQLHAALHGRVLAALAAWTGDPDITAAVTMIPDVAPRSLTRAEAGIRAELAFSWLLEVWARGLAVTAGRFTLAANTADGLGWRLRAVEPDLGAPSTVTLSVEA